MKIAVVGAGLAGLGLTWHLLDQKDHVVLFDAQGIGKGASGVATTLLHPFPGKRALRSWKATEGMQATLELLHIAEQALGRRVVERSGIFRPAMTEQQKVDFLERARQDKEAQWRKISLPGMPPTEGLWIESGMTIDTPLYLEGLWRACQQRGACFVEQKIHRLEELADFDVAILATGWEILQFKECCHLPLKMTLGQALLCPWEEPLPYSLVSQGHISPTNQKGFCHIGSTYEHTASPDPQKARALLKQVSLFYPPAATFEIARIRSGIRATQREGYRPLIAQIAPKTWVFSGLGSRGLLYHAYLGKGIALDLKNRNPHHKWEL